METRPTAAILTIGDELLKGRALNTNAQFLGRELTRLGFKVRAQKSCPDETGPIIASLREALAEAPVVVLTGGLGPTPDDVTREAVAEHYGVSLEFSQDQYRHIVRYYKGRKKNVPAIVRKEALFPSNAVPLVNRHGIALGFSIEDGKHLVAVLPGVPREQEKMFAELVTPLLKKKFPGLKAKYSLVVKTAGISEPDVMSKLGSSFFSDPFDFGIYPYAGEVSFFNQAETPAVITRLRRHIEKRLKEHVYAYEDLSLAEVVGRLLLKKRATLAAAESCTGGALSAVLTSVPGSSRYFKGGVVAYANEIKEKQLGVPAAVLNSKGAVSPETARAMARGVREKCRAVYGVGITGIAGPDGGTKTKPVGTVCIALAGPRQTRVWKFVFSGDRQAIQTKSTVKALELLWRELRGPRGLR
ncbi:MAG TPA: competence/damage-inducible protein A [Verrucomicrobiae bacterium]|jgi:nicotinamide-nucleotide amidase|nr:competence/damage-inducible protein A [Verrucomicrobiae bacterium]